MFPNTYGLRMEEVPGIGTFSVGAKLAYNEHKVRGIHYAQLYMTIVPTEILRRCGYQ
jgi:hypothetical protein